MQGVVEFSRRTKIQFIGKDKMEKKIVTRSTVDTLRCKVIIKYRTRKVPLFVAFVTKN